MAEEGPAEVLISFPGVEDMVAWGFWEARTELFSFGVHLDPLVWTTLLYHIHSRRMQLSSLDVYNLIIPFQTMS